MHSHHGHHPLVVQLARPAVQWSRGAGRRGAARRNRSVRKSAPRSLAGGGGGSTQASVSSSTCASSSLSAATRLVFRPQLGQRRLLGGGEEQPRLAAGDPRGSRRRERELVGGHRPAGVGRHHERRALGCSALQLLEHLAEPLRPPAVVVPGQRLRKGRELTGSHCNHRASKCSVSPARVSRVPRSSSTTASSSSTRPISSSSASSTSDSSLPGSQRERPRGRHRPVDE